MKRLLPLLVLVLVLVLACALFIQYARADIALVALTDVHFVKTEAGILRIEGMVKNLSDRSLRQVYVALNPLRNGMVVGYTTAIIFNLALDDTWHVEAPCRTCIFKPDHFRLAELSAIP
ncbi:FxLYD domain-containing protein [Cronobacter dublinensis]